MKTGNRLAKHLTLAATLLALMATSTLAENDKVAPMWEGTELTSARQLANEKFIADALAKANGDRKAAAQDTLQSGWKLIDQGDAEGAMRRFNQAWLLDPQEGRIYWGFAVASAIRGDALATIDRFFEKTHSLVGDQSRLYADWGRVYLLRGKPADAEKHFNRALEIDPDDPAAHFGLMKVGKALGDRQLMEKHKKALDALKN